MEYSLRLFRGTRSMLREALTSLAARDQRRIVIYGTGEAAELAYLTIVELGLTLVAIVSEGATDGRFCGVPVLPLSSLRAEDVDAVILAIFDPAPRATGELKALGIAPENIVSLA